MLLETNKPTGGPKEEKRKFLRVPDNIKVLFCVEGSDDKNVVFKEGTAVNLGGGGIKLTTDHHLTVGSNLSLIFNLPFGAVEETKIETRGKVIYIENNGSGRFSYGIVFDYINTVDQDKIVRYVLKKDTAQKSKIEIIDLFEYFG